jgi:hypothetical protein
VTGELTLEAQEPLVVAGLDQFMHEGGSGGEADRLAFFWQAASRAVARLFDAPAVWSRQPQMLGLACNVFGRLPCCSGSNRKGPKLMARSGMASTIGYLCRQMQILRRFRHSGRGAVAEARGQPSQHG